MKKTFIITLAIFTMGVLLYLNGSLDIFFSSQNNNKLIINNEDKNGISNKINSILNKKSVIKPIQATHLIVFKAEKRLDFFVTDSLFNKHLISSSKIELSSNINGTKLYDEALNLPEGCYNIESIIKKPTPYIVLNFPNEFDINKQVADKRPRLNSEISIGLVDNNIILDSLIFNQLLQLNELVSPKKMEIIIVPNDFRNGQSIPFCLICPPWTEELYGSLRLKLSEFE